jgi:hypothetical protein
MNYGCRVASVYEKMGAKRMADDDNERAKSDRRKGDRRVADDPDFKGPERRKGDRRTGKGRRSGD